MSFKSTSTAKVLLVALLVIGSTSGYFARNLSGELETAKSGVVSAQNALSGAQKASQELQATLTPDATPASLENAMSALVLDVYNLRLQHGITVASANPAKATSGSSAAPLDTLAEAVPGTKVQSVRINVRGSYSGYLGLMAYINALQTHPVSVVHLRVQEQNFELGLRVYGDLSGS